MDTYDKTVLIAEIENGNEKCILNHGYYDTSDYIAINYIVCPIGFNNQKTQELVIPICQKCENTLQENEWVLLYCLHCNRNVWVLRKFSKLDYCDKKITWMNQCPNCYDKKEKVEVFFNE